MNEEQARIQYMLASRSEFVIGIDEVGTGAIAGPVAVGAVVTKVDWFHKEVKDSKKYADNRTVTANEKRIIVLRNVIEAQVEYITHTKMTSEEIDLYGIRGAWTRCVWIVATRCLKYFPDAVIVVDGDTTGSVPTHNALALPKADQFVPAVSAASVVAKVERDGIMILAHDIYPAYGFSGHKGYGSRQHLLALDEHGPCPLHRQSYSLVRRATEQWQQTRQLKSAMRDSMP